MSAPFRYRQRAEAFAARVDGIPAGVVEPSMGASAEDDRFVDIVSGLRQQVELDALATPRAAYATSLRALLMAEAPTVLAEQKVLPAAPPRVRGKRQRGLVAVATAAVLLGGSAGMAAAAQNSLPGEALYPIKRGIEQADAGLSRSEAGRGRDLLQQATERLREVQGLVDTGPTDGAAQIPGTLDVFTRQAREGADLMMKAYQDTGHRHTIAVVRSFAADDLDVLTSLSDHTPDEAQPQLQEAALTLQSIDQQAGALCEDCSELDPLQIPATFLASAGVVQGLGGTGGPAQGRVVPGAERRARVGDEPGAPASAPASVPASVPASAPPSAPASPGLPTTAAPDPGGVLPAPPDVSAPADPTAPASEPPTAPAGTPPATDSPAPPEDSPTPPSDPPTTTPTDESTPSQSISPPTDAPSGSASASASGPSTGPGPSGPTSPSDPASSSGLTDS